MEQRKRERRPEVQLYRPPCSRSQPTRSSEEDSARSRSDSRGSSTGRTDGNRRMRVLTFRNKPSPPQHRQEEDGWRQTSSREIVDTSPTPTLSMEVVWKKRGSTIESQRKVFDLTAREKPTKKIDKVFDLSARERPANQPSKVPDFSVEKPTIKVDKVYGLPVEKPTNKPSKVHFLPAERPVSKIDKVYDLRETTTNKPSESTPTPAKSDSVCVDKPEKFTVAPTLPLDTEQKFSGETVYYYSMPKKEAMPVRNEEATGKSRTDEPRQPLKMMKAWTVKKPSKPQNEMLLNNCEQLFEKMELLTRDSICDYTELQIGAVRAKLINSCERMLLADLSASRRHNVLTRLWQLAYYSFISGYRSEIGDCETKPEYCCLLLAIIDDGIRDFESLLDKLYEKYQFCFADLIDRFKHYDLDRKRFQHLQECAYFVKIIFIYLGDLARYFEMAQKSPDYNLSKKYYLKAHVVVPKNAHISSQLALISYKERNFLDTIYYNIRSIEIPPRQQDLKRNHLDLLPPAQLVKKQNLTVIFDSIQQEFNLNFTPFKQQHWKFIEKNRLQRKYELRKQSRINRYYRIEYWVRPNQTISICDMYNFYDLAAVNSNQSDPDFLQFYLAKVLPDLSPDQIYTNFLYSFLNSLGLLNCRTGLDCYFDVSDQLLAEMDFLLERLDSQLENRSLATFMLVKMFAICIFTISNTFTADNVAKNPGQYSFTHMNAHFILATLVTKILERLIGLFSVFWEAHTEWLKEPPSGQLNGQHKFDDSNVTLSSIETFFGSIANLNPPENNQPLQVFNLLLPCIKIWTDWFITCEPLLPPQDMNDHKTNLNVNVWDVLAEFLTQLDQVNEIPVEFYQDPMQEAYSIERPTPDGDSRSGFELIQLPEDRFLDGFIYTRSSPESSKYVRLPFIPEIACLYIRIASIKQFGRYLCGLEKPYMQYHKTISMFISLVGVDDIEGSPGLKVKDLQEEVFRKSIDEAEKLNLECEPNGNQELVLYEEDEDDNEAIQEMKSLNICASERMKLIQYRMLRRKNQNQSNLFKAIEHKNEPKRRFIIKPHYVVFDTNCFINDIEAIKQFIIRAPFIVTVPLIVIHELEYISIRGKRCQNENLPSSSSSSSSVAEKEAHFLKLSKLATEILDFLKLAFEKYRPGIKAVTSKGSLMDQFDFSEEFYDPNAFNNDDLVLFSCTNLVKDDTQLGAAERTEMQQLLANAGLQTSPNDEFVFRDVILVTDDKNLRLKSLCYDVPVRKLKQFLKWTRTLDKMKS